MSARRTARTRMTAIAVVGVAAAMVLVACSSSSSSSSSTSAAASAPAASSAAASSAAPSSAAASAAPTASASAAPQTALIDPTTLPVTIPFTDRANHVIVEAGFGSDKTYPMMFDTGAASTVSADLVKEYGFPSLGQQTADAGGGQITSDIVGIDKVTLGDLSVNMVLGTSPWVDSKNALSCITEAGLIGPSAMTNAVWQLDYQAKTVTVTESTDGINHVQGAIAIPFNMDKGTPVINVNVGSGQVPFLVDTGSSFGMVAGPKELQAVGVQPPADAPVQKQRLVGAAGSTDQTVPFVTTTVGLGDKTIDYPIAVQDIIPNVGNMGNAFLSQYVVTFDFPNKTMYLDPVSADGAVANPPVAGVSLGWDGTNAIVGSLAVGGKADKAGLKLGDVVTDADGSAITTRDEFCTALIKPALKSITTSAGTFDAAPVADFFKVQ